MISAKDVRLMVRIPILLKELENCIKDAASEAEVGYHYKGRLPTEVHKVLRKAGYEMTYKSDEKLTWIWWGC